MSVVRDARERVWVVGEGRVVSLALFLTWFATAAILPVAAIGGRAAWIPAAVPALMILLIQFFGRRASPSAWAVKLWNDHAQHRLQRAAAADVRIAAGTAGDYVLLVPLLGVMLWGVALAVGAVAYKHPSLGSEVAAFATLLGATALMNRIAYPAQSHVDMRVGADGVRDEHGAFVAYDAMPSIEDTMVKVLYERGADRDALELMMREVGRRRALAEAAKSGNGATAVRERVAHEPSMRDNAPPIDDLVRVLHDGSAPREERVRVAELLRVHAPEEVERAALETADDEFEDQIALRKR